MAAALWLIFSLAVIAVGGRLLCAPLLSRLPISPWLGAVFTALAGLYLASVVYFFSLAAFGAPRLGLAVAEGGGIAMILASVLGLSRRENRSYASAADDLSPATLTHWPGRAVLLLTAGLACAYTAGFVIRSLKAPHGYLDAVMTWNRGARFLFRDKDHWLNNFDVVNILFLPEYPLFLQSTIARLWTYLGTEHWVVPAALAYAFAALVAALLYGALAQLRGRAAAAFALCLLLGSTIFVQSAYNQVADVPVATFMLASVVVLSLGERYGLDALARWASAGAFAGAAAWMKNEGILFVLALGASALLVTGPPWFRRETLRRLLGYGLGATCGMVPVLVLKLGFAPPGYLAAGGLDALIARLGDGSRYLEVLTLMSRELVRFGSFLIPVLAVLALLGGVERDIAHRQSVRAGLITLAFLLLGYFAFYMVTPFSIGWHVGTSFERLLVQILPLGLFLVFSSIRAPQALAAGGRRIV